MATSLLSNPQRDRKTKSNRISEPTVSILFGGLLVTSYPLRFQARFQSSQSHGFARGICAPETLQELAMPWSRHKCGSRASSKMPVNKSTPANETADIRYQILDVDIYIYTYI